MDKSKKRAIGAWPIVDVCGGDLNCALVSFDCSLACSEMRHFVFFQQLGAGYDGYSYKEDHSNKYTCENEGFDTRMATLICK